MNHSLIQAAALVAFSLLLFSCGNNPKEATDPQSAKADFTAEKNLVDTLTLRESAFSKEIISNGHLQGNRRAELSFAVQGTVANVLVKNGSRVRKGDTLAYLDTQSLRMNLEKSLQSLAKSKLDLYDALIGFGYSSDTTEVPKDILDVAKVRSGYRAALHDYTLAQMNWDHAFLTAPFAGVVANLSAKPFEKNGDSVCLVIDDSSFDVAFSLLEAELPFLTIGQKIRISPFIDLTESYTGSISEINPLVDDKGRILVVARMTNPGKKLIEGMNVKIFLESHSERKLAVPKSAVVMRDGFDVLFTYNPQTGTAGWVYVDVLQSNSTHHVVQGNALKNATLTSGQIIITEGNLNLADGSKVEIKQK